jgi:hypothetical protein
MSSEKRSMHDDIEVWEDCCVCEPEPRWQKLAEELEREKKESQNASPDANVPVENERGKAATVQKWQGASAEE